MEILNHKKLAINNNSIPREKATEDKLQRAAPHCSGENLQNRTHHYGVGLKGLC